MLTLLVFSLLIGPTELNLGDLLEGDAKAWLIFQESRLPRTLSILLAASSMAIAGLVMQTMTQNHFAAPSTVGTVEAAQLGLLLSIMVFPSATLFQKMAFAFFSSILSTLLFLQVIKGLTLKEKWLLPLIGIIYSGIIGSLARALAYQFNLVQSMTSWTQGSFSMIQRNQYEWLFLALVVLLVVWRFSASFTLMSLGRDTSRYLGLSYEVFERLGVILVALATSVTMITVGGLPFLGVIVPNLVRRYAGDHISRNLWLVAMYGACLVLVCDILARLLISPYELSVSLILGILGSITFVILIVRGDANA